MFCTQASEAECERMFSQQGRAHTKYRANLADELVESEVIIRSMAKKKKREREDDTVSNEGNVADLERACFSHTDCMMVINAHAMRTRFDHFNIPPNAKASTKSSVISRSA
eukprot:PhM_4_TR17411/c2_g3_i6/m.29491